VLATCGPIANRPNLRRIPSYPQANRPYATVSMYDTPAGDLDSAIPKRGIIALWFTARVFPECIWAIARIDTSQLK
jgi:hypothetical protein